MQINIGRSLAIRSTFLLYSMGLAGCFPSVEQHYFAATGPVHKFGATVNCSAQDDASVKLPAGAAMNVIPPGFPEKKGEALNLRVSVPAGHSASFVDSEATFRLANSTNEWRGLVLGTGSAIHGTTGEHITYSDNTFPAKTEIRGGTLRGTSVDAGSDDVFSYKVESDHPFPKEFSVRLPDISVDGSAVAIPEVHFRYGRSVVLCGCCGT